ncbi:hypothetical protein H6758_02795 [Candidatus Nomurabacteria bacterium]|nr:hypothetical protein [Candidatus Nomurabacteria bacterium]
MKQRNLKRHFLIVIAHYFIGVLVIALAIVLPATKHILQLQRDIQNFEADLESRYTKAKHLRKSLQELDQVEAMTLKYASSTAELDKGLEFIQKLNALAAKHGVEQNLSIATHENKSHPLVDTSISKYYFILAFQNQAPLQNQLAYMNALEQMEQFMIIDRLSFQKQGSLTSDSVILRFDGIVYAQ